MLRGLRLFRCRLSFFGYALLGFISLYASAIATASANDLHVGGNSYVKGDYYGAAYLLIPIADQHPLAAAMVGDMYNRGVGAPKDDLEAYYWFRKSIHLGGGNSAALNRLPNVSAILGAYRKLSGKYGRVLPKTDAEVAAYYEKLPTGGSALDHYRVGMVKLYGRGVPVDERDAFSRFLVAAGLSNIYAMRQAGIMLFSGKGTSRNIAESVVSLLSAAQAGDAIAQHFLGDFNIGLLPEKRPEKAFGWYLKAAKKNYARSQMMAGALLFQGKGIEANQIEGAKWSMLALNRLGPKENKMVMLTLRQRFSALSPAQRTEVQDRARTFLEGFQGTFPKDQ